MPRRAGRPPLRPSPPPTRRPCHPCRRRHQHQNPPLGVRSSVGSGGGGREQTNATTVTGSVVPGERAVHPTAGGRLRRHGRESTAAAGRGAQEGDPRGAGEGREDPPPPSPLTSPDRPPMLDRFGQVHRRGRTQET